ncbi:hypothetical protein I4F81_011889 [Pyropia yezoensis]|uniref:Uncharacterized protein n=1 Tax=Pyropia yezoensis TaxID=2788 RepID=A0ACC3CI58_PYRYE|nr:hypothetical protein I4F81_011889 [Neopyropia yezoensis]
MDSPALPPAPPPLVPAPPTPDAATMAGVSWSGLSYDVPVSPASTTSPAARARAWLAALTGRGSGGGGGGGNGDGGGGSPPAGRGPLLPTHMANGATPVAVPADLTAKGDDSGLSSGVSSGSSSGSSRPLAMKTPAADGAAAPNGVGGGDAATGTATAATAAARAPTGTPPRAPNTNRILHGVSGVAPAGQLTVLLGPSGAGKTSLLNLLAGRSQYGPSGGTMTFAGAPRGRRLRRQLAYCMQADIFSPRLTVAETLRFTARLRIRGASRAEREARVAGVLAQLRLEGCADTLMGDGVVVKGVSGGERKRVNIANELLTDPSTLLLDEPTSGLDSATALTVVRLLRALADEGRTIITTLHQPSSQMLALFDNIMLLSSGRVVYSGPAEGALPHFASLGLPCPPHYNPCDFFLQLLTDAAPDGSQPVTRQLEAAWAAREAAGDGASAVAAAVATAAAAAAAAAAAESSPAATAAAVGPGGAGGGGLLATTAAGAARSVRKRVRTPGVREEPRKYPVGWWTQAVVLGGRSAIQRRGEVLEWVQMFQIVAVAFLVGIMWFQLEQTERTLDERVSILFFICVFFSFIPMFSAIFSFMPAEGPVLHKERSSGAYRLSAFFVAKTTVETPVELLYPALFSIVAYWMAGLRSSAGAFALHLFILALIVLTAQSIGLFVSASVRNVKLAQVLGSLTVLLALLAGGYYVNNNTLPGWIAWVKTFSFIKYGFEAMVITEVQGRTFPCAAVPTIYSGGLPGTPGDRVCPVTAAAIYRAREVDDGLGVAGNVGVLLLWIALFRVAAYCSLKWLHVTHKPSRRVAV